jgi:hypothetical protein
MPKELTARKRAAILADIQAKAMTRNDIARKHKVSGSTVTKLAREVPGAFDRSQTQQAARAKQFDAKLARARLVEDLYGDAQRFRDRGWSEYTQIVSGPAGAEFVTTKLPPLREQQSAYTSVAICIDKADKLVHADAASDGSAGAKSLLGQLGAAFAAAADSYEPPVPDDPARPPAAGPAPDAGQPTN